MDPEFDFNFEVIYGRCFNLDPYGEQCTRRADIFLLYHDTGWAGGVCNACWNTWKDLEAYQISKEEFFVLIVMNE